MWSLMLQEINLKLTSSAAEDLTKNGNDFLQVDDDVYIQESVDKASVFCRCKPSRPSKLVGLQLCQPIEEQVRASIKKQEYLLCDVEASFRRKSSQPTNIFPNFPPLTSSAIFAELERSIFDRQLSRGLISKGTDATVVRCSL